VRTFPRRRRAFAQPVSGLRMVPCFLTSAVTALHLPSAYSFTRPGSLSTPPLPSVGSRTSAPRAPRQTRGRAAGRPYRPLTATASPVGLSAVVAGVDGCCGDPDGILSVRHDPHHSTSR
jgi:hypothetical protein